LPQRPTQSPIKLTTPSHPDACNTLGAWGSGIALQLRRQFPAAYSIYANHCKTNHAEDLLGTCLLIAPQEKDIDRTKPVWIACLFTSVGYGKGNKRNGNPGVSSKEDIVKATAPALLRMLLDWESERENEAAKEDGAEEKTPDSAIFCPKFNAGSFGVEWEKTEELIVQKWGAVEAQWTVVSR
jgi:ADP-ribose 1''-phosphate phosphatase